MPRQIREGLFETNSSSSHSLCIPKGMFTVPCSLSMDNGVVAIYPDEFGWGPEMHHDILTKAAYCLTYAKSLTPQHYGEERGEDSPQTIELLEQLANVIKKHQKGCTKVLFRCMQSSYDPWGHIDHQSDSVCAEAFQDDDTLANFLFNTDAVLIIDNDNH